MRYIADVLNNLCSHLFDVVVVILYLFVGFSILMNIASDSIGIYGSFIKILENSFGNFPDFNKLTFL